MDIVSRRCNCDGAIVTKYQLEKLKIQHNRITIKVKIKISSHLYRKVTTSYIQIYIYNIQL